MFDEKVALMGQEDELSESRTTEQGTLIALTSRQMVTLFTTGPEGRVTVAPMEVVLDGAKGAAGEKVGIASLHPRHLDGGLTPDPPALPVRSYHPTPHGELGLQASAANRQAAGGRNTNTRSTKPHQ